MSFLESLVLGVVQGLTEFLPISSTAHLRIVPAFIGTGDPGAAFTAVTQLGTAAAVLIYFRADLWRIVPAFLGSLRALEGPRAPGASPEAKLGWYLALGTIPIVIFGVLFKHQIETSARSLTLIGISLIVLGLVLLLAEAVGKRERGSESLTLRDGIVVGFAQALALVPGVSRSGATISAGLFLGLTRADAARFSFLLSVPAVLLSAAYEAPKALSPDPSDPGVMALVVATVTAFVVGYATIALLLRWLASHSTGVFVVYRIGLGTLVLVLVATGSIT